MSAVRALRQIAGPSSRVFAARIGATRSFTRAALPAFRVSASPAAKWFSVSARRFGEGSSESFPSSYDMLLRAVADCLGARCSGPRAVTEARRGASVRDRDERLCRP
jgi:hypothetical protein